jgi:hypothetical protein
MYSMITPKTRESRINNHRYIYIYIDADFMPMGVAVHSVAAVGSEDHMHSIY